MQTFLQDTATLKNLQNKHILSVVGVCVTTSEEPMIIMPFMATEDLKSYIREPSKVSYVREPSKVRYIREPSKVSYCREPSKVSYVREPSKVSYVKEPS